MDVNQCQQSMAKVVPDGIERWNMSYWVHDMFCTSDTRSVPIHPKQDKVPYVPEWNAHGWILYHAFFPLAIHHAYTSFIGLNIRPTYAFAFYASSFNLTIIHLLKTLRRIGRVHGFFNGDLHQRNNMPHPGTVKATLWLFFGATFRIMMTVFFSYGIHQEPTSINLMYLPIEIGAYGIVMDLWYYWYHRLMHSNDLLWKYHRTHHLVKHPNQLLALHTDTAECVSEAVIIPLLAYLCLKCIGLPMGFYEWWVCHHYITFSEIAGHSGLRVHASSPSTVTWLLKLLDAELVLEDHDLHHRRGWKRSHNYGKQTRLWDRVFGTCYERIECSEDNIDYVNTAHVPIF